MHLEALDAAFPNVGPGPDPLRLAELTAAAEPADPKTTDRLDPAHDAIVLLLQRDYHCGKCRRQVRAVADRYEEFRDRGATVVSIVPEPRDRVAEWQDAYDLPYPLCADPEKAAGRAFDQPVRFGPLGRHSDLLGRMPTAVVLDVHEPGDARVAHVHRGHSTLDRPTIDELLADVDELEKAGLADREREPPTEGRETRVDGRPEPRSRERGRAERSDP